MRSESKRERKPEEMLLRVIRAAQILVKGQDESTANAVHNTANKPIDRNVDREQKTQN
jgi:hypothetical protein